MVKCFFFIVPQAKIMGLADLEDVHLSFHLAVNKQITDKTQNIFSLTFDYSEFIKYFWNKVSSIILINGIKTCLFVVWCWMTIIILSNES